MEAVAPPPTPPKKKIGALVEGEVPEIPEVMNNKNFFHAARKKYFLETFMHKTKSITFDKHSTAPRPPPFGFNICQ
jgi:hypothetical protein